MFDNCFRWLFDKTSERHRAGEAAHENDVTLNVPCARTWLKQPNLN